MPSEPLSGGPNHFAFSSAEANALNTRSGSAGRSARSRRWRARSTARSSRAPLARGLGVLGEVLAEPVEAPLPFRRAAARSSRSASRIAAGRTLQRRARPTFSEATSPLASSTCRCCTTPGSEIASGRASSLTVAGPAAQVFDDLAPGGVAEGVEHLLDGIALVKHLLKYDILAGDARARAEGHPGERPRGRGRGSEQRPGAS